MQQCSAIYDILHFLLRLIDEYIEIPEGKREEVRKKFDNFISNKELKIYQQT
jgi:hypothetical protein